MTKCILLALFATSLTACSYPLGLVNSPSEGAAAAGGFNSANIDPQLQSAALGVLNRNCASCHTSSSGPANVYGLDSVSHLFNSGLLVAGNPNGSPLFQSIQAGRMPQQGPLSAADQDIIRQFIISAGAASGSNPALQPTPAPTPEPTFSYISSQILGPNCAGCHYQGNAKGGYAFDTYQSVLRAVNKSSPTRSVLYTVSQEGEMPPRPRQVLNSEQLNLILTWIQKGALNN